MVGQELDPLSEMCCLCLLPHHRAAVLGGREGDLKVLK